MVGIRPRTPEAPAAKTQRVTLHGVSWQTYTQLLAELGDQRASRLAYDQGVLEITMPIVHEEVVLCKSARSSEQPV